MSPDAQAILASLQAVAAERERRQREPALAAAVLAVKAFQHARLAASHADLRASPRFGEAARFFLDDLYGPTDFTERDEQFARIVPAMTRLLPAELLATVAALARLHGMSESLDSAMGAVLAGRAVDAAAYAAAWRAVGRADEREQQIALVHRIGTSLDHYTHVPGLRRTLHLMRMPARMAGLAALQQFLERGFDTFHAMHGAGEFLDAIQARERAHAAQLFAPDAAQ
jgi:hypothetical protein